MENELYLYGASGHAKVVLENFTSKDILVKAIIDDAPKSDFLLNVPVIHSKDFVVSNSNRFVIAIGSNVIRKKITSQHSLIYTSIIHSDATVSKSATIGEGTVIMPQVVVNAEASIGKHCILNSRSVVEHDCILDDYVHISPNASLAGNVVVGEGTQIGIGASVIQGITIGKWVTVGAGAVIINDIPDYAVVVGNPGKIIKYNL